MDSFDDEIVVRLHAISVRLVYRFQNMPIENTVNNNPTPLRISQNQNFEKKLASKNAVQLLK